MGSYILRRLLYAIPILVGVNVLTFFLFFVVNTPDSMARMHLGMKHVTPEAIQSWKIDHGYDVPLFFNSKKTGVDSLKETIFFRKSMSLFVFRFGESDQGRDIGDDIRHRMWPSLAIQIPVFFLGMAVYISFALLMVFFRGTYLDTGGVILCVILMSISGMFYIIGGQYLFGKLLHLTPISGYQPGWSSIAFVALPVIVGVVGGIGGSSRWYRTLFLEEAGKDYVRTAWAKGLGDVRVLFVHVLKNGMVPILTGAVSVLPLLFMGALVLESFFGIPGLGSYTIDAIQSQDFAIVRAIVFLGTCLYILGLLMTDLSYSLVDPRVRLEG
ncbi:MAG: ABC transporter permease [Gammaproteobacteria bacterium]|nr:MAG: ABC transporter permease [Gammaproteobacteria bacterium]